MARRPLELEIFPLDDEGEYRHPLHGFAIMRYDIENKRLSDAELAAEYHAQQAYTQYWDSRSTVPTRIRNEGRLAVLYRMATLPQHDEEDTE